MPNDDLISRKALYAAWDKIDETEFNDPNLRIDEMIRLTQDAPAVDAEPVVHSKWEMIPVNGVACYRCGNLNCARLMPFGCVPHELPRCPYCGAKMKRRNELCVNMSSSTTLPNYGSLWSLRRDDKCPSE